VLVESSLERVEAYSKHVPTPYEYDILDRVIVLHSLTVFGFEDVYGYGNLGTYGLALECLDVASVVEFRVCESAICGVNSPGLG